MTDSENTSLTEEHAKELIEKYGHVESTVSMDMDDYVCTDHECPCDFD